MEDNKCIERERTAMKRIIAFRLPFIYKRIGLAMVVIGFLVLLLKFFNIEEIETTRAIGRLLMVVGLLLISLASDKQEDELTVQLRSQSYTIAFIVGVIYAIIMPFVEFGVSNVIHSGDEGFKNLGDFQILFFMLIVQLMYYHVLKRYR
ncbi:MAG: hypothetical protein ACWA5P_12025 [bacterium]